MRAILRLEDGRELHMSRDDHYIEVDMYPVLLQRGQPYYWMLADGVRTDLDEAEARAIIQTLTEP